MSDTGTIEQFSALLDESGVADVIRRLYIVLERRMQFIDRLLNGPRHMRRAPLLFTLEIKIVAQKCLFYIRFIRGHAKRHQATLRTEFFAHNAEASPSPTRQGEEEVEMREPVV